MSNTLYVVICFWILYNSIINKKAIGNQSPHGEKKLGKLLSSLDTKLYNQRRYFIIDYCRTLFFVCEERSFLYVQNKYHNTILKRIYKFCDEAFIEKRSPHKVRKTFASILVNDGIMDISEVAQLLGHVSEQTLINHYLYPTKSSETRRERLEKALAM